MELFNRNYSGLTVCLLCFNVLCHCLHFKILFSKSYCSNKKKKETTSSCLFQGRVGSPRMQRPVHSPRALRRGGGGQPGLGGGAAGAGAWRQEWAWRDEAWAWPGAGRGGPGSSGHPGGRWQRRRFSPPQAPCRSSACSRRWAPWRPPSGARSISAPSSWALSPSCSLRTSSKAGARRTSLRGPGACLSWETSSTWTLKSRSWRFSG